MLRPNLGQLDYSPSKTQKTDERPLEISPNSPPSSPSKQRTTLDLTENSVENSKRRCIGNYLETLSIGLTHGVDGFDNLHSAEAVEFYIEVSKTIFLALANNDQDDYVSIGLNDTTLTLTNVGLNVEMDMDGVTKIIWDKTVNELKNQLCLEIFRQADPNENKLSAYAWNVMRFGKNFKIYDKELTGIIDKSQLYMSMRGGRVFGNLNCKVPTPIPGTFYECRHFVVQLIRAILAHAKGNGKTDWTHFADRRLVAATMPTPIEADYNTLKMNAKNYVLIANDRLGSHVVTCFKNMRDQKEKIRTLMLFSTTHVMAIILEIKEYEVEPLSEAKPIFVVDFYDPNYPTNATKSCATTDLTVVKSRTLKYYINGSMDGKGDDYYQSYYNGVAPYSLILECDSASFEGISKKITKPLINFTQDTITPTHMYLLFKFNFLNEINDELLNCLKKVGEDSPDQLFALLSGKNNEGVSWLHYALGQGKNETLAAFLTLLRELKHLIPENKLVELIAAENANGIPGYYYALKMGHAQTVGLFAEYIKLLPSEKERGKLISPRAANSMFELLATKSRTGGTRIRYALATDGMETSKFYLTLLRALKPFISEDAMAELIAAEDANGVPGIYFAFENGETEKVEFYGEFLKLIPTETMRANLIPARGANGKSGMRVARENGHTETCIACVNWVDTLIKDQTIRAQVISSVHAIAERNMTIGQ